MPFLSTLRSRFIITLVLMLTLMMGILVFILHQLTIPNLLNEERQSAYVYAYVLQDSIDDNAQALHDMTHRWATWDNTQDYMEGRLPDFPGRYMTSAALAEEDVDLVVLTDIHDGIVRIAGRNPATGEFTSCSDTTAQCQWAIRHVQQIKKELPDSDTSPRTWTHPLPALSSTWPITHTGNYRIAGKLTMVRFLPEKWQPGPVADTRPVLTLSSTPQSQLTTDDQPVHIDLLDSNTMRLAIARTSTTPGEQMLLTTRLERASLHAGIQYFNTIMLIALALLLLLLVIMLLVFRSIVLRPIAELSEYARNLRNATDGNLQPPPRWLQARSDELGIMAREFQQLIRDLNERNAHLKALSHRDALTGLGNRRLLDRQLPRILSLTHRLERPVALIMIDVDHFKAYNDFYGHPEGDQCLKTIADTLKDIFQRESDLVARIGGEEFVIVLPDFDLERAMDIARGVCTAMEAQCIPHERSTTHKYVTISAGVAISTPMVPLSGERLIKQADDALYQVKKSSRNAVGCGQMTVDTHD